MSVEPLDPCFRETLRREAIFGSFLDHRADRTGDPTVEPGALHVISLRTDFLIAPRERLNSRLEGEGWILPWTISRHTLREHDGRRAVTSTASIIGRKWTAVIVHDLSEGPRRYSELERACQGISPRTLVERLQSLERRGLVARRAYSECPPRVEYALTPEGTGLLPIIDAMSRFGRDWLVGERRTG